MPNTPEDETSTALDDFEGDLTPYYQDTGGGHGGPSSGLPPTTLDDTPGTGGGDRGFDGLQEVIYRFETCAFCAKGEDAGHYFGCIIWEFRKTAADNAARNPGISRFIGISDRPSAGFMQAVAQWAQNHDFDLPGRQ